MKHAVAYYRASTSQQEASVEQQEQTVKRWCIERDINIQNAYREHLSGVTSDRPLFRQMITDLDGDIPRYEHVDYVLFYDVSRLGRFADPDEATYWIQHLKRLGMEVVFVQDEYECNLGGRIKRFLDSEMASEYSKKLSALVTRGMKHNAEQGHWNGGPAPFGYDRAYRYINANEDRQIRVRLGPGTCAPKGAKVFLVVNEEEANTVKCIFEGRKKGQSLMNIAYRLNSFPQTTEGTWNKQKVARVLANESLYRGTLTWTVRGGKFGVADEEIEVIGGDIPSIL